MTDHIWYNIPDALKKGLIQVLTLKLIESEPDTALGLSRRLSVLLDNYDFDVTDMKRLLGKELAHQAILKEDKYVLTPGGKEIVPDSVYEIKRVLSFVTEPTKEGQ